MEILAKTKSSTGSPYCYYKVEATVDNNNRTTTTARVTITVTSNLANSDSSLGTGSTFGLIGYIDFSGDTREISLKSTSTSWSGTKEHTASGVFDISCAAGSTSLTNITFWALRTGSAADNSSKGAQILSSKKKTCADITGIAVAYTAPVFTSQPSVANVYEEGFSAYMGSTDQAANFYWSLDGSNWNYISSSPFVVGGLTRATSYTCYVKAVNPNDSSLYNTTDFSVTTYNYPYINSWPNGKTLGTDMNSSLELSFSLYNPIGRTVTLTAYYNNAVIKTTTTSSTSASMSILLDDIYKKIPNDTSMPLYLEAVWMYTSNIKIGSTTITLTVPSSLTPILDISKFKYNTTHNAVLDGIYSDISTLVANLSSLNVWYENGLGTGKNYATITSATIKFDNYTQNLTTSSTAFNGGITFNYVANRPATIEIIDSRGFKTSNSINISCINYLKPIAYLTANRENGFGSTITIDITETYSQIGTNNIVKKEWSTDQNTWYDIENYPTITVSSDSTQMIYARVLDNIGNNYSTKVYSDPVGFFINKGQPTFVIDTINNTIGINKIPDVGKALDIDGGITMSENTGNVLGYFYSGTGYDLNNFTTPGMYGVYDCTNQPISGALASLVVIKYSADWIVQLFFRPASTSTLYCRSWYNGTTWSSWERMIGASNFTLDGTTLYITTD